MPFNHSSQQTDSTLLRQTGADSAFGVSQDSGARRNLSTFRFSDTETTEDSSGQPDSSFGEPVKLTGPGLFKGHALPQKNPNALPYNDFVSDWFTIALLILLALFTSFRFFYFRIFKQLLNAFFNVTVTNQIVRDESVLLQRASLILSVISYMLAGMFLYQISIHYNWQATYLQKGLLRFGLMAVAIAMAYSLKMIFLRFLSGVFGQERPVALYIFNIFLMLMMMGLVLLPVNILLAFSPSFMREGIILGAIILLGIMFTYRLLRAIGIWVGIPGFSFLYLFLYLCAFEIAPLLIIYKLAGL
jgi:hypothetical protein